MSDTPIRILIKPAKRLFTKRQQWTFEIRGSNGEPIDPRETYNNRNDAIHSMCVLFGGEPVELVIYDKGGDVEERRILR
jgi:hypothetical protein